MRNHYFEEDQLDDILCQFYGSENSTKTQRSEGGKFKKHSDAK
jgi:hypothetical protein